jgi:hypothetical protein
VFLEDVGEVGFRSNRRRSIFRLLTSSVRGYVAAVWKSERPDAKLTNRFREEESLATRLLTNGISQRVHNRSGATQKLAAGVAIATRACCVRRSSKDLPFNGRAGVMLEYL